MKKTIILSMVLLLLCNGWSGAINQTNQKPIEIFVNGKYVQSDVDPVLINERTYIPIRAISEAMGINNVQWNTSTRTATVTNQQFQMEMGIGKQYISSNGRYFYAEDGVLLLQNRTMAPVRAFANASGAKVEWNGEKRQVYITQSNKPVLTAQQVYNEEDIYWLSRIIHAESEGESLVGQIAVGNVVLNRVRSSDYPNNIHDVIFDTNYGVQFEPTQNGTINNTPSDRAIIAAKICLEGYSTAGECLYFLNIKTAQSLWITNNRNYYSTIGNHSFYL
jgi:N-acetylmuramoyl-L-alanine amidase